MPITLSSLKSRINSFDITIQEMETSEGYYIQKEVTMNNCTIKLFHSISYSKMLDVLDSLVPEVHIKHMFPDVVMVLDTDFKEKLLKEHMDNLLILANESEKST